MWYDPRITLSHNCLFNFVVGARSAGKTFNTLTYCCDKFFKAAPDDPFEFAYIRRYKPEMKQTQEHLFDDLVANGYLENCKINTKNNPGLINKKPVVNFFTLSTTAGMVKSVPYPNVKLIVFEEFLVNKGQRYLPNEVDRFLELYVTIARNRDVPVLFLANATSQSNPYFLKFGIRPNGQEFQKIKNPDGSTDILLHTWRDEQQQEERKKSRFGSIIAGTTYEDYAVNNLYWYDDSSFIEKRDPQSTLKFLMYWNGKTYSVWSSLRKGKIWIDSSLNPPSAYTYCFTTDEQKPNYLLARAFKTGGHFKLMQSAQAQGCLYFNDINCKNAWFEMSRLINLT